ncbi:unnamed protein product [Rotaria magnacalcarata]|uniref:FAT domain-containing protein n=1 Tax=Rotaria magnacalcarata TaxID=392030 RepID=A0A816MAF6_9BILA|nr:unnamed protein product [Rotaria magnacalcarata]
MAFLQDDNERLRAAMETVIDEDAIRAMSCFENRDFEGLKVSMRKMTNSQVTGEELGRSISCSWDMEAFDMLATVETLKRASKRRSSLWSLNAVLQLTQDLTRIHNVDEHASWSEELAAISQVTALYQSENREVPLLPGQKFAPAQHSVRSLNSIFLYSQPSFNNQRSPLRSFHSDASSIETYSLVSLVTMIERYQNVHMITIERETEAGKLMHTLSLNKVNNINLTIAIEFLSRSILRHLINDSQPNPQYNNQRSLINIEKCSRNLLHIAQWSRTAIEIDHEATTKNVILSSLDLGQPVRSVLPSVCSFYFQMYVRKRKTNNNDDDASNVLVTSRLLRVLVRYPQQLRTIFETNLLNLPTIAWKRLIPQLFPRLNHPRSFVRAYVTNLLIDIAKDFPQLILYSVVVGITDDSKMRRIKSRDDNIWQRKFASTHESEDDIDEDDEEEDDIEKQENVVAMQNSFRLIYNVLSETNSHVVEQVKLFVREIRRVYCSMG